MKMIRYGFAILIFLTILLNSCSNKPQSSNLIADCGPLELNSYDDISKTKQKVDQKNDQYNLSELEFYYVPASPLLKGNLDKILIKDRYVCLYYYANKIDQSQIKDEKVRILNTIKLEWTRNADGVELLKNTIKQLNLYCRTGGDTNPSGRWGAFAPSTRSTSIFSSHRAPCLSQWDASPRIRGETYGGDNK